MNMVGNVLINFGTNLLKLAHDVTKGRDYSILKQSADGDGDVGEEGGMARPDTPEHPAVSKDDMQHQGLSSEMITSLDGAASSVQNALSNVPPPKLKWAGIVFFALGASLNFISYSYAAQSLLAAIASIQFVSNVFFGWVVLRERVTPRVQLATAIIVFGNIFVVSCASRKALPYTASQLLELYDYQFRAFGLCMIGLVIFLHIIYSYFRERERLGSPLPHSALVVPILYSCVAAMIGTQSVVQAKCLSTLIHASWAGENQLGHLFTYVVLFLFLGGTFFWLYRVNKALSSFDGLFIIPVLQAFFVIWTIIVGGVYFKEFEAFTFARLFGFVLGVMIVVVGVFLLAPPPAAAESTGPLPRPDGADNVERPPINGVAGLDRRDDPAASRNPAWRQQQAEQRIYAPRSRSSRNNWGLSKAPRPDIPVIITPLDSTLFNMASLMSPGGGDDDHIPTPAR